jgi:hypothetical protein
VGRSTSGSGIGLSRTIRHIPPPGWEEGAPPEVGDLVAVILRATATEVRREVTVEAPLPAGTVPVRPKSCPAVELPELPPGIRVEWLGDRVRFRVPELDARGVDLPVLLRITHRGAFLLRPASAVAAYPAGSEGSSGEARLEVR